MGLIIFVYFSSRKKSCPCKTEGYHNTRGDHPLWSFWHDDNFPEPVKLAIKSWEHYTPFTIHVLTLDTMWDYITKEDLPSNFDKLSVQKKTDLLRLSLLYKYGGTWCDSTFIMTKPIKDWFPDSYDLFGFYIDKFTTKEEYPILESWFISAPRGSPPIKLWREEMNKHVLDEDAFFKMAQNKVDFQNIEDKKYLLIHCVWQYVVQTHPELKHQKIVLYPAQTNGGPFKYLDMFDFNSGKAVKYITGQDSSNLNVLALKLRGAERDKVNKKWNDINDKSIIGRIKNL